MNVTQLVIASEDVGSVKTEDMHNWTVVLQELLSAIKQYLQLR